MVMGIHIVVGRRVVVIVMVMLVVIGLVLPTRCDVSRGIMMVMKLVKVVLQVSGRGVGE